jgi:hypothetical protein
VWDVIEALGLACIVAGGFLMFGPAALVIGGVLVLILSWFVNRKGGSS